MTEDWKGNKILFVREVDLFCFFFFFLIPGDGFHFENVSFVEMGTNILFPYSKLSNESITEDWEGNKYFFAELPDVYSTPNIEEEQRVRYSNTKKKF